MTTKRREQKRTSRIPRNSPCPCGSGKKYKYCCGKPDSSLRVKPDNEPEVIDYHLISSDDGRTWTKRPGALMAVVGGARPEDSDEAIERLMGKFIGAASDGADRELRSKLVDCRHKLYAVRYHLATLKDEIEERVEQFREKYSAHSGAYFELENPTLIYEAEAFLFQVKSSLDLLIGALGARVGPLKTMKTFSKKRDHAGGRVIEALRKNNYESLAELFDEHRKEWIQELVDLRDRITHYSRLRGFHCFVEEPYRGDNEVSIHYPTMPSGERVDDYCQNVFDRLLDLYDNALSSVLDVDL